MLGWLLEPAVPARTHIDIGAEALTTVRKRVCNRHRLALLSHHPLGVADPFHDGRRRNTPHAS